MLSRVADSLFWLSRYLERAESVANLVSVNLQLVLDLPTEQGKHYSKDWSPIIAGLGEEEVFRESHRRYDARTVAESLVFDREMPNSVLGSLAAARENARTVREQITLEMWEQINRTYLWICSRQAHEQFERNDWEFFQRLMKSLQLFQGIVGMMMVRETGWEFLQMGKFLERADKVTRLLDEQFHLFREEKTVQENEADTHRWPEYLSWEEWHAEDRQRIDGSHHCWMAVLQCCHARAAYQRLYPSVVQPVKVTELLLLNERFPRSMLFSVSRVERALCRVNGSEDGRFTNRAEKYSGQLASELRFSSIADLFESGLHDKMDEFQIKINRIGEAIREDCIFPPLSAMAEVE